MIESKNSHLVRRYGFYLRYDTPVDLLALNHLLRLVNDRLNYLAPAKKPIGYGTGRDDRPASPLQRLLAAGVLALAQAAELVATATRGSPPPSPGRSPTSKPS